jgi:16S rRNA (guanine527-N7)-methyltransferase
VNAGLSPELYVGLRRGLAAADQPSGPEVVERLALYVAELVRWSRRMSLTTLDPPAIVERLIQPSLQLATLPVYRAAVAVADLGSGGGIPGVPLQIVSPRPRLALIEARQRRAAFLRHLVRTCDLTGVEVVEARAESLLWPPEQLVDVAVSRAVAPAATVLPWCLGLVRAGGTVVIAGRGGARAEEVDLPGWEAVAQDAAARLPVRLYRRCST